MDHLRTDGAQVFSRWHNDGIIGYRKRPRDPAQLTKLMIDIASGNAREDEQPKRDVTERNALRFARVELARVTQMVALGEMAASIAHEINQPLAAIAANGNAGLRWLTRRTPDVAEARAAFQHIVDDSRRASEVISGIRSIFKKDGQGKAPHDINELIREVLALVRGEVENHQVSVQMELCEELPQVATNQVQLRQVFVNLIMNAVDAMSNVVNRPRILRLRSEIHDLKTVC
jgi:C4-dicarboxylate-specific signal transduction histidine kinase